MGVDVMRPVFNFEPKYRVTMLTRKDWTKGTGAPVIKGFVWFTYGSRMKGGGTRVGVHGQLVQRGLSFSLGRHATVLQAEIHAILACTYEIQVQNRSEKYIFALIVKRPSKLLRLSERLLWSNSARRR
jgi:hypothetical protein